MVFTRGGDSKVVLKALAERNQIENIKITLITGASLGHDTDGALAHNHALHKRLPFQVDRTLRKEINNGNVLFVDQHLSKTSDLISNGTFPIDVGVLEVAEILEDGHLVPTTSIGNNVAIAENAQKLIIEINTSIPKNIRGIHDIYSVNEHQNKPINICSASDRIGTDTIKVDPKKIVAIVFQDIQDAPGDITPPDEQTEAIAKNIVRFLENEVKQGRLDNSLRPLQCGIGKVANAVLGGMIDSDFENLTMYSEVFQDSTFDLIDSGKLVFASASAMLSLIHI